jgi:hypothetical protein
VLIKNPVGKLMTGGGGRGDVVEGGSGAVQSNNVMVFLKALRGWSPSGEGAREAQSLQV